MSNNFDYRSVAQQVLTTEIEALQQLNQYIIDNFVRACEMMLDNKNGHIGKK